MPARFLVVCEAEADFRIASELAERVFEQEIDWFRDSLPGCPIWQTTENGATFITWKRLARLAQERQVRINGQFAPGSGEPYAYQTRRALLVAKKVWGGSFDGILLLADSDHKPERRRGMDQAVGMTSEYRDRTVIGLAHPCREAWVLVGYETRSDGERESLDGLRQALGFHPCERPEALNAKDEADDPRSAKRIARHLFGDSHDRQADCWRVTRLDILEARGHSSGLSDYLAQIRERFVPILLKPAS